MGENEEQLGVVSNKDMAVLVQWKNKNVWVEKKCTTCISGALDDDANPCKTCFALWTPQNRGFSQWQFDPEYDPSEDVF